MRGREASSEIELLFNLQGGLQALRGVRPRARGACGGAPGFVAESWSFGDGRFHFRSVPLQSGSGIGGCGSPYQETSSVNSELLSPPEAFR